MSPACIVLAVAAFVVGVGSAIVIVSACAVSSAWSAREEQTEQTQDVV